MQRALIIFARKSPNDRAEIDSSSSSRRNSRLRLESSDSPGSRSHNSSISVSFLPHPREHSSSAVIIARPMRAKHKTHAENHRGFPPHKAPSVSLRFRPRVRVRPAVTKSSRKRRAGERGRKGGSRREFARTHRYTMLSIRPIDDTRDTMEHAAEIIKSASSSLSGSVSMCESSGGSFVWDDSRRDNLQSRLRATGEDCSGF